MKNNLVKEKSKSKLRLKNMKEKAESPISSERKKSSEKLDLLEKMIENLTFKSKQDLNLLKNNKESTFLKEEKDMLLLKLKNSMLKEELSEKLSLLYHNKSKLSMFLNKL